MASIFTKIVRGEIPSYKVAETDEFLAFLDINPLVKGHTLVIPKQEIDQLFDIPDEVLSRMILFAKRVAIAIKHEIPCERIGMTVIGLEVPHAHIHLIPIRQMSDMDFSRPKLSLPAEEMQRLAERLHTVFSS